MTHQPVEDHGAKRDRGSQPSAGSLANRQWPISIAIVDQNSFTRECITRSLRGFGRGLDVLSFAACEDYLESARSRDLILYHAHENGTDRHRIDRAAGLTRRVDGEDRHEGVKRLIKVAPLIILSAVERPGSILQAFEYGARAYVPTMSTSVELLIEIIRLVRAGGTFVPPSLSLRGHRQELSPLDIVRLSPRELEVLDQLKQGKTNKIIAHELSVSASTVKVHVRNIMKKMNATNRTEVACRAYACADDPIPGVTRERSDAG